MKVLDKVELKPRENCPKCKGDGYQLYIVPQLSATKFRVARPCSCISQIVHIKEE